MIDAFLSDAGFVFFALWVLVIAAICTTAFGEELLSRNLQFDRIRTRHSRDVRSDLR